jgi:Protein of unknown function (DUF2917)
MMKWQQRSRSSLALASAHRRLLGGQVERVGAGPGELTVIDGRVWLTRRGDCLDHVLERGQQMALKGDDDVLVEAWDAKGGASVRWRPAPQAVPRGGLVAALRRVMRGLAALALPFDAIARKAASSASRAQGRICSGESIACGGAVQ